MTIAKKIGLSLLDDNLKMSIEDTAGIAPINTVSELPASKIHNYYRVIGDNADRHKIYEWNETNAQYELLGIDDRVSLAWVDLKDKPTEFTPSTHTHDVADIENNTLTWGSLTDKPTEFTPASHEHNSSYYQKSEVDDSISTARDSKNIIVNPDMDIWQRGTSFTIANNTGAYTADRHYVYNDSGIDVSVTKQYMDEINANGLRCVYSSSAPSSSDGICYIYGIENTIAKKYAGEDITVSFYLKAVGSTSSITVQIRNSSVDAMQYPSDTLITESDVFPVDTTTSRYSYTFTMPSSVTIGAGAVFIVLKANGLGNDDGFLLSKVCIEKGSVATSYIEADSNIEVEKCNRYLKKPILWERTLANTIQTNIIKFLIPINVNLRISPSILGVHNTDINVRERNGSIHSGFVFNANKSSGGIFVTAEKDYHGLTDAQIGISSLSGFDAEL